MSTNINNRNRRSLLSLTVAAIIAVFALSFPLLTDGVYSVDNDIPPIAGDPEWGNGGGGGG